MNPTVERAQSLFVSKSYHCAESTLIALAESQGIASDLIPKIATGFGSGLARTCGICGAVSGAIMALGLINGRTEPNADREPNYAAVQQLLREFAARHGSTNCFDLTGCDFATPEGQQKFNANQMHTQCSDYIATAIQLALRETTGG
ncbi:MAG TPA: C-GCAxxG-C-C family protein [Aggregatilineaceae bacterium]|nr:C-GCAxxG-C-C family protein [Aggregatilineaceae bacterium]